MTDVENVREIESRMALMTLAQRFSPVLKIRPARLAELLIRVFGPEERRRIVSTTDGLKIFIDPFSHLGGIILRDGVYEPETASLLKSNLRQGDTFLDIGANEGYFSAMAARLVGPTGFVIAVEPQQRLCDIVHINLRLNNCTRFLVSNNAVGGEDGEVGTLHLWPILNTGASSIARRYRFSRRVQSFTFVTPETLSAATGRDSIALAKVDVEGFEPEVVRYLIPMLRTGQIQKLLVDYHELQLRERNIDPRSIHALLLEAGCHEPEGQSAHLRSYVLYTSVGSTSSG